jgi:cyclic pyranopterin phosphate synthase
VSAAITFTDPRLEAFRRFNEMGGKFRVAVINTCNLDCFFCHNEGMSNPRRPDAHDADRRRDAAHASLDTLLGLTNAFARLGGMQVNVTGGEPLLHAGLPAFLRAIDRTRGTRVILNTNALEIEPLLRDGERLPLDAIFASLHTTDERVFARELVALARPADKSGAKSAARVMANLVRLKGAGYEVQVNYSLGPHNQAGFREVLDFTLAHGIALKAIALVRHTPAAGFYGGAWVDPAWIAAELEARGGAIASESTAMGGQTTLWSVRGTPVKVKNIARGRLRTSYCDGCAHVDACGEGIYGLRLGPDGLFKPCLLRAEKYRAFSSLPFEDQVLDEIARMMGPAESARFDAGAPA